MDFDIIALIAIGGFYLLRMLAGRNKQNQAERKGTGYQGAPETAADAPVAEPGDLDDALAEIRRALGMESPPARDTASPSPAVQAAESRGPDTRWPSEITESEAEAVPSTFHRVKTGRPDLESRFESRSKKLEASLEDGFESAPRSGGPAYDDKFRRKEMSVTGLEDRFERSLGEFRDPLKDHDHVDDSTKSVERPEARSPAVAGRLATRAALQEAFVLKEIVGPPRSKQRNVR